MRERDQERIMQAEAAGDWLIRLEEQGSASHAEFLEWLRRSPEHVREFLAVSAVSQRLGGMDRARRIDVGQLIERAKANVAALPDREPPRTSREKPLLSRRVLGAALAASVVAAAIGITISLSGRSHVEEHATRIGEQRSVKLPDGSLIQLNTASRVNVRYSADLRQVELVEGEALFTVAGDASRPFRVDAGHAVIRALGTQFNVYRQPTGTRISVMEGLVQIDAPPAATLRLAAGEQAEVSAMGRMASSRMPDSAAAIAWQQRRLVFRNATLAEVAAEFNRYNALQLRVEGTELRARRLTGVFNADRPEALLLFLGRDGSIESRRDDDGLTLRARP